MSVDLRLLNLCKSSDERAQSILYKECYSLMKGICTRYINDRAEVPDVMNRGFLKIIKGLGQYDTSRSFNAWISRIMINACLDHLRKRKRNKFIFYTDPSEDLSFSSNGSSAWNSADLDFEAEELLKMIHRLPQRTSQVFNLFAIDGYSHEEISQLLEISTGTSKWHVSKAREQLKKIIQEKKIKEQYHS